MTMGIAKDLKCWEIMKCKDSDDCPARKEPNTPCWEVAARLGDYRSALKVCSDCLVYMLHNNVPVISEQECHCIFKKKGIMPE